MVLIYATLYPHLDKNNDLKIIKMKTHRVENQQHWILVIQRRSSWGEVREVGLGDTYLKW